LIFFEKNKNKNKRKRKGRGISNGALVWPCWLPKHQIKMLSSVLRLSMTFVGIVDPQRSQMLVSLTGLDSLPWADNFEDTNLFINYLPFPFPSPILFYFFFSDIHMSLSPLQALFVGKWLCSRLLSPEKIFHVGKNSYFILLFSQLEKLCPFYGKGKMERNVLNIIPAEDWCCQKPGDGTRTGDIRKEKKNGGGEGNY
jgi:hypothetical protein